MKTTDESHRAASVGNRALDSVRRVDKLSDMGTVNTRQLQKETRSVRNRLLAGETLEWVSGKRTIGYLTPAEKPSDPDPWPDVAARLASIYPGHEGSTEPAATLIYEDRD